MAIVVIILCIAIFIYAIVKEVSSSNKETSDSLNAMYEQKVNSLESEYRQKLSSLEAHEEAVNQRERHLNEREGHIVALESKEQSLQKNIAKLEKEYAESKKEFEINYNKLVEDNFLDSIKPLVSLDLEDSTSSEIKNQLSLFKKEHADLVKNRSVAFTKNIDAPARYKNKLTRRILMVFNAEVTGLLNKLTISNIDSTRNKINTAFDRVNKLFDDDNIKITTNYLRYQLSLLEINYQFILKKHNEKEQQAAIKEQMLDEAKAQKELEKEQKRILSEQRKFNNELSKTMKYLSNSTDSVQSEIYAEKIRELEAKIKQLESDKEDVDNRLLNTRAGYVYVISNIGSFGENIYKIGMTKRLNPLDRVNELGSASVPFKFDVHAMIFSDDAPALENHLHKVFADKSVNKINPRKEFFNVSLKDIEKEVLEHFDATVEFTEFAKAEEYRRSLELATEV